MSDTGFQVGVHYDFAADPNPGIMMGTQDDWCVVLNAPYAGLMGKFKDVRIVDQGRKLNYTFEIIYRPEAMKLGPDYDDHIKEVLISVMKVGQKKGFWIYSSKEPE